MGRRSLAAADILTNIIEKVENNLQDPAGKGD
jgi:hypothetical protein